MLCNGSPPASWRCVKSTMQLPGPGGIKQRQPRIRSALLPPLPPSREPWAAAQLRSNHLFPRGS